ncbi:MAG: alpha/beta family hydrolase, partial [Candidatus Limnocylindrales bacterium]
MRVLIAHGASGRAASMQAHVDGLRRLGVEAAAVDLPLRVAEKAVPVYRQHVEAAGVPVDRLIVSGQSYGGRVASLLAAEDEPACAGLICFSYPLHRPGHPDWDQRSSHWPRIDVPVLLLSGESDPFARADLLRRAVEERLPSARLVMYPKVGHSLKPVLDEVLGEAA